MTIFRRFAAVLLLAGVVVAPTMAMADASVTYTVPIYQPELDFGYWIHICRAIVAYIF